MSGAWSEDDSSDSPFVGYTTLRAIIGPNLAFVYHATNGLRVVWMDFFGGSRYHKKLFAGTLVVAGVLFVAGAIPMLQHAFGG